VFRSANPTLAPFHDQGWQRGLLYPVSYQPDDTEFHALSAAAAIGETQAYASEIEGYDGTDFNAGRAHALIDLGGDRLDLPFPPFSPIVETAVYSLTDRFG